MQLRKAERKKAKLRIGFSGPSGSGKTYSALQMAYGMVGDWTKIALIDSENGSGELYSELGEYNILTLDAPYTPERYIDAINACEKGGMDIIIIDSTSHEWEGEGGCLQLNEKLAGAKFKGNTWAAWSETTPRHQKFIEAIVTSKCHIITTARSKTDTIQTEDKKIKKVGTKEIQREGFEYELTANFNIDRDHHLAIASKDRTGLFIDRDPFLITSEIGKEIIAWNQSGLDGEAMEAERKAREAKEQEEREARETQEREDLYNSLLNDMQKVKFIDDLASIWNTQVQPNKVLLGEAYIKDLTERKDAIKAELQKTPVKSPTKPEQIQSVQKDPLPQNIAVSNEIVESIPEENIQVQPPVPSPPIERKPLKIDDYNDVLYMIKHAKNEKEEDEAKNHVEQVYKNGRMSEDQYKSLNAVISHLFINHTSHE